jgi:hypothetical protein
MTVGRNIGKGWMTGHGAVPSPASSGGLEDDHSQRLCVLFFISLMLHSLLCSPLCFPLGGWLRYMADNRLDHWLSANASMAVGSLTGPQLDTTPFQPLPNTFDPNVMMNPTTAPSPFSTQQWDMGSMQVDWNAPPPVQFGNTGDVVFPVIEGGQENSDEYWNALIDGES